MRLLVSSAILASLLVVVGQARAEDFYVDPEAGSPDWDGSATNPWRTLQEVVEAGLSSSHPTSANVELVNSEGG